MTRKQNRTRSSSPRRLLAVTATLAATALLPLSIATPVHAAVGAGKGDSGPAVTSDTSAPLSSYPSAGDPAADKGAGKKEHFDKRDAGLPQQSPGGGRDAALQTSAATTAAPTSTSFEGLGAGLSGFAVNSAPPDTDAAVSPTQIVETVNSGLAVFNKTGGVLYGPVLTNTLWSGFGGSCQSTNDGDAVVRWDRAAGRWVIAQFANAASTSGPYYECIAVSTTADATGSYYRYSFQFANFPDYPKLGVWPDAYYVTYNLFSGNTFKGAESCAMDRAKMLTGAVATQQCFTTGTSYGGLLPADNAGGTAPPAGEPALHVALGATANTLAAWKFHVDWTTPANSTFTGPTTLAVATFSQACSGGTCIPQSGTTTKLDSLADRLMYHLSYRNNGGTESLVLTHSVTAGSSTGVRWYELRNPGATPTVFQQGTYAPDAAYRWMGSAAMDKSGGIAVGYSTSSSTTFPSIRYAGRAATDAAGTLTTGEGTLYAGSGSQTGTLTRWGDYASMSIDPSDDCTFWFASEYLASSGSFNWHTRIGHFALPSCGGTVANDFTISDSPASGSVVQGSSATTTVSTAVASGTAETVSFSASGLPTGATATFAPTSVTAGGSSTLTLATSASTPAGTYPITITGTAPSATHTASYSLTVTAAGGTSAITNGGFETGSLSAWTAVGTTGVSTVSHTGTYSALTGASSPTNGVSSVAQTFTAPAGTSTLSFWWESSCPDTVTYDWATATLKDNTTGTTTTVLAKTCAASVAWAKVSAAVTAGHSYTLTLVNRDDNYTGDPTYTRYDDVALA